MNVTRVFAISFGLLVAVIGLSETRGDEVIARPEFGISDQASVFPLALLKVTERLISEHERLTEERISVITFKTTPAGGFTDFARTIAGEWRKDAPQPPNSVLIAVDDETGKLEIRTGLGIDPELTAAKIAEIRKTIFSEEWAAENKSRALVLTFVEVLRSLGSPLTQADEATDAYARAGFSGGWMPKVPVKKNSNPWIFALAGILIAAFALERILIGEAHYTAEGWFPVPASRNLKRLIRRRIKTTLVTGGGVSGKY